jgi:hypothetical protein
MTEQSSSTASTQKGSFVDELRTVQKEATPGPWHRTVWVSGEVDVMAEDHSTLFRASEMRTTEVRRANVGLIVLLRNHALDIAAVLEAAREVVRNWDDLSADTDTAFEAELNSGRVVDNLEAALDALEGPFFDPSDGYNAEGGPDYGS